MVRSEAGRACVSAAPLVVAALPVFLIGPRPICPLDYKPADSGSDRQSAVTCGAT